MISTSILKKFFSMRNVFADFPTAGYPAGSEMNTVVVDGNGFVQIPNNVRLVYSKEIEFKAMPIMRFAQFAKVKTELVNAPGLTIKMMTYNNLKRGGALTEGTHMKTQSMSNSMTEITVLEQGNAVSYSELTLKASFTDVMADATTLLGRDMALTLDCELRDVALAGTNVIYGRKDSTATKIISRANITTDNFLSVASIKDAVEILATNNCPKFEGNYYICFVHPHQSRTLRDDPAWIEASKYGAPDQLFSGEIGRIEDVRFIETTLMSNGACASTDDAYNASLVHGTAGAPATIDVYQSVIFGEDFYGYAVGLPVELRDNGVTDFGREHALAWYAIWGCKILHNDRGVIIETC
jgi:N4-gp56 family major capsid protein